METDDVCLILRIVKSSKLENVKHAVAFKPGPETMMLNNVREYKYKTNIT